MDFRALFLSSLLIFGAVHGSGQQVKHEKRQDNLKKGVITVVVLSILTWWYLDKDKAQSALGQVDQVKQYSEKNRKNLVRKTKESAKNLGDSFCEEIYLWKWG